MYWKVLAFLVLMTLATPAAGGETMLAFNEPPVVTSERVLRREAREQIQKQEQAAEPSYTKELKKRTVLLPADPEEVLTAEKGILQSFGDRMQFTFRGDDPRSGIELNMRLYESRGGGYIPEHTLEMKPKLGREPSVQFIFRF